MDSTCGSGCLDLMYEMLVELQRKRREDKSAGLTETDGQIVALALMIGIAEAEAGRSRHRAVADSWTIGR